MARSVLIVEDDADLREMMAQLLSVEGFEPRTAVNGRDAIDQLASGLNADVILLDLMMPVMDGQHFLEQCRRNPACAGIPVIVMSAASDRASHLEAAAVFCKPLDFGRVLDTVRRYCHTVFDGIGHALADWVSGDESEADALRAQGNVLRANKDYCARVRYSRRPLR